jgi:7-cyano-7-deazaguanine synthase in queuosine biosynthesis
MSSLILWSGGADSTALLLHCLRELQDPVYALYIETINHEHRSDAENLAIDKCQAWLEANERPFTLYKATLDIRDLPPNDNEQIPHFGIAAMVAKSLPDVVRIGIGWCSEEGGVYPGTEFVYGWLLKSIAEYRHEGSRDGIDLYIPFSELSKSVALDYMGPELAPLTWSCRRPTSTSEGYQVCGECMTCEILIAIAKGETYEFAGTPVRRD